ncbi:MAG: NifU family protein [Gemmataceae bacterium]
MSESSGQMALKDRVTEVLASEVGPALELNDSGIEVLDADEGIVRIRLRNICTGCPSTIMTIIMGLEQELRRLIPEVQYIEATY